MQPQYVGNNDFRGYLNYLGTQGDNRAKNATSYGGYGYVDNNGAINQNALSNYLTNAQGLTAGQDQFVGAYRGERDYLSGAYNQWSQAQQQSPTNDYSSSTIAGAGSAGTNPEFINKAYDTKIAGLKSVLDTYDPQEDSARLNVNNQYTNQANSLQSQRAIGQRNLAMAGEQVQEGKVKGIADLNRQVQGMGMSYNNQLGAYGAGDSSAADLIQRALSGMASRNRSDVLGNASTQQRGIDLQGQDLETEFGNNMKSLDDWKTTSLTDIAQKFMQQRQAIQQQMVGANADRYQALAAADANYVNQAIAELGRLEGTYRQNAAELVSQYKNLQSPNARINPELQQFAVKPISAGKIAQMSFAPSASNGSQPLAVGQRRPFEEDYGFGF